MLKILFLLLGVFHFTHSMADNLVMKVIPLNNRFASDLQPLISPFLENSERIVANRSSLIVKATPARQKEIKKLIDQLDSRLNNLTITVIQSNTESSESLNASARIRVPPHTNRQSNLPYRFRGRFANTESLNHSNSQQQIQTLDGKAAYIKIGKIHPVKNINIYHSDYAYPVITSHTQLIEATTGFMVTPHLSGKQVTLDVTPWSEKMNNSGVLSTQSGHTTIQVKLGKWVEIGGIDEQNQLSTDRTLSHAYSTTNKNMRILIKVEKM